MGGFIYLDAFTYYVLLQLMLYLDVCTIDACLAMGLPLFHDYNRYGVGIVTWCHAN